MRKLRQNDEVIVLTGKDKGERGQLKRWVGKHRVLISGVNIIKKHQKPNPQKGVSGGIIEKEAPMSASNVAIFNAAINKADKVVIKIEDTKKIRIFKSSGEAID